MRRRVRCVSLIFFDGCDFLDVLVLMCAAKLTPAKGRQVNRATNRRRRLVLFNILLIHSPDTCTYYDARRLPAGGNPSRALDFADITGLSIILATKKFRLSETLISI